MWRYISRGIKLDDSHLNGAGSQPVCRSIWTGASNIAAESKDTGLCWPTPQCLYLFVIYRSDARKLGFSNCSARLLRDLLGYSNEDWLVLQSIRHRELDRELFENKHVLAVLCPGQKLDCLVQCNQNSFFFHRKSQQVCISDLLVAEDSLSEWSGKGSPACRDGPIAVTGMACQRGQHSGRFRHRI